MVLQIVTVHICTDSYTVHCSVFYCTVHICTDCTVLLEKLEYPRNSFKKPKRNSLWKTQQNSLWKTQVNPLWNARWNSLQKTLRMSLGKLTGILSGKVAEFFKGKTSRNFNENSTEILTETIADFSRKTPWNLEYPMECWSNSVRNFCGISYVELHKISQGNSSEFLVENCVEFRQFFQKSD